MSKEKLNQTKQTMSTKGSNEEDLKAKEKAEAMAEAVAASVPDVFKDEEVPYEPMSDEGLLEGSPIPVEGQVIKSESTEEATNEVEKDKEASDEEETSEPLEDLSLLTETSDLKPKITVPDLDDSDALTQLLADPEEYKKSIKSEILQELSQEQSRQQAVIAEWEKFYTENPDLAKSKKLVSYITKELKDEFKGKEASLNLGEVQKLLADRARKLIRSVKGELEEVDTSNTAVVSSSGISAPKRVTKPVVQKGFVEQIRGFQASKRA